MNGSFTRILTGVLLTLAGIIATVACGGESAAPTATPEPTAAPTAALAAESSEQETTTEDRSGSISTTRFVQLFVDPPTLDPHLTTDATSARIIVEVFGVW